MLIRIVHGNRNILFDLSRMRSGAWLALVALAASQFVLAGHQFEGDVSNVADLCHVCVQLDRLDDCVAAHVSLTTVEVSNQSAVPLPTATLSEPAPCRAFNSRAPPLL